MPFRQWPELKLGWGTQTLPRLYRIHHIFGCTINNERRRVLSSMDFEGSPEILRRKRIQNKNAFARQNYHVLLQLASTRWTIHTETKQIEYTTGWSLMKTISCIVVNRQRYESQNYHTGYRLRDRKPNIWVFSVLKWTRICHRQK